MMDDFIWGAIIGGIFGIFSPDTPPFEGLSMIYESKRQLEPLGYKLLAKSPQIQYGRCYDRENNSFGANMNITEKSEPDKYQIVIQKIPDPEDPASYVEQYRGYMSYGDTHFDSDTEEKTAFKFFRNKKQGKPFLLAEIKEEDGQVKRMCCFYIYLKKKK